MNRRELFAGLGAALAAASMPVTIEVLVALPDSEIHCYLWRVKNDLINKIANPPCLMKEDGTIEILPVEPQIEALRHVDRLLTEFS